MTISKVPLLAKPSNLINLPLRCGERPAEGELSIIIQLCLQTSALLLTAAQPEHSRACLAPQRRYIGAFLIERPHWTLRRRKRYLLTHPDSRLLCFAVNFQKPTTRTRRPRNAATRWHRASWPCPTCPGARCTLTTVPSTARRPTASLPRRASTRKTTRWMPATLLGTCRFVIPRSFSVYIYIYILFRVYLLPWVWLFVQSWSTITMFLQGRGGSHFSFSSWHL